MVVRLFSHAMSRQRRSGPPSALSRMALPVAIGLCLASVTLVTTFNMMFRMPADIFQLGAAVGHYVEGLVENGYYGVELADGRVFVASKMPLLPTLYAGLFVVTGTTLAVLVLKNAAFSAALALFLFR